MKLDNFTIIGININSFCCKILARFAKTKHILRVMLRIVLSSVLQMLLNCKTNFNYDTQLFLFFGGPLGAVSPREEDVLFSLNCGLLDLPNADQSSPTDYKVFVRINICHKICPWLLSLRRQYFSWLKVGVICSSENGFLAYLKTSEMLGAVKIYATHLFLYCTRIR